MTPIEVVISGIGGLFPESEDLAQFGEHLLKGASLARTDSTRWRPGTMGEPTNLVKVGPAVRRFDNTLFSMHRPLTECLDPMIRTVYERSLEALIDAGINPRALSGTNAQVYAALSLSESDIIADFMNVRYMMLGVTKAMMSNRISFFLNTHGPSATLLGDWSVAVTCLDRAAQAIRTGVCDIALVAAATVTGMPEISKIHADLGFLSPDGQCKSFDAEGNGCARGEGAVVLVLQRADQARRVYAGLAAAGELVNGHRPGMLSVDTENIAAFLADLYRKASVDPLDVDLFLADGAAIPVIDVADLASAATVLCAGRKTPLPVSAAKGVVGHADAATALFSLVAGIVAMEAQCMPPVTGFRKPVPGMPTEMEVVRGRRLWPVGARSTVAISALGCAGCVGHVVLRAHPRHKPPVTPEDRSFPRLVLASGRTEEQVVQVVKKIADTPFDPEYIRLTQEVFKDQLLSYSHRAFTVLPSKLPEPEIQYMESADPARPLWLVYSGMGSQWVGMGSSLMQLPVFVQTIGRLHNALLPKGVDLIHVLTTGSSDIFDNILHSFVGIAAVQIGLTNVLRALDVKVAGLVGHSVGELGCAYADGGLTEEQTILAAYARGRASLEANLEPGMMAAVGLGWKEVRPLLPDSVDVACHNAVDSCTVSGPARDVQALVKQLQDKGVFARAVNVSNIAYHSRYIRAAAPSLLRYLKEVIPAPLPRSSLWVSSSVPADRLDSQDAKMCSAEYHTNNLLSPVLFEEAMRAVPEGAVVVEVAPHGLLQAAVRRGLPDRASSIALTRRGENDGLLFLLRAVGRMFLEGIPVKVSALAPDVSFPVSRGTPSLGNLATWDHRDEWPLRLAPDQKRPLYITMLPAVSPVLLFGGRRFCPPSYILERVWDAVGFGVPLGECPIVFENLLFTEPIDFSENVELRMTLQLQEQTGKFEVSYQGRSLVRGRAYRASEEDVLDKVKMEPRSDQSGPHTHLTAKDVHGELLSRGYEFFPKYDTFKEVVVSDKELRGSCVWEENWAALLDAFLQLETLSSDTGSILRCAIRRLAIAPAGVPTREVIVHKDVATGTLWCPGARMDGIRTMPIVRAESVTALRVDVVPLTTDSAETEADFFFQAAQLTLMNSGCASLKVSLVELPGARSTDISNRMTHCLVDLLGEEAAVEVVQVDPRAKELPEGCPLILCGPHDLRTGWAERLLHMTETSGGSKATPLILVHGMGDALCSSLAVVRRYTGLPQPMILLCKVHSGDAPIPQVVHMLPNQATPSSHDIRSEGRVVLVWHATPHDGILGAVTRVRGTAYAKRTVLMFVLDADAPRFSLSESLFSDQLRLGMAVNVLHGGQWGTVQLQPFSCKPTGPRVEGVEAFCVSRSVSGASGYCGMLDGRRVMGIAWRDETGADIASQTLHWPVPDSWSSEQAAGVPAAYATAYLALGLPGFWKRGKGEVLIIGGASAVGVAAVRVALSYGLTVSVAVDSPEQGESVLANAPELPRDAILSTANFEERIRRRTGGRGVGMVLCAESGSPALAGLRCVGVFGEVIFLGESAGFETGHMGLFVFLKNMSVRRCNALTLRTVDAETKERVVRSLSEGISLDVVRLLGSTGAVKARLTDRSCLVVGSSSNAVLTVARVLARDSALPVGYLALAAREAVSARAQLLPARCTVLPAPDSPRSAARLLSLAAESAPLATLAAVVVIEEDDKTQMSHLMDAALRQSKLSTPLITLSATVTGLTGTLESRLQACLPTSVVLGPVGVSARVLPALLAHRDPHDLPAVLLAREAGKAVDAFVARYCDNDDINTLKVEGPSTLNTLTGSRSLEITTLSPRRRHLRSLKFSGCGSEPATLFAILGGPALRSLARCIMSPLIALVPVPGRDTQGEVLLLTEEILRAQPQGPWSLLADASSAALALSLAVQLERRVAAHPGTQPEQCAVVALVDEKGRWSSALWGPSVISESEPRHSGPLHVIRPGARGRAGTNRLTERIALHAVPCGDESALARVVNEHLLSNPYRIFACRQKPRSRGNVCGRSN